MGVCSSYREEYWTWAWTCIVGVLDTFAPTNQLMTSIARYVSQTSCIHLKTYDVIWINDSAFVFRTLSKKLNMLTKVCFLLCPQVLIKTVMKSRFTVLSAGVKVIISVNFCLCWLVVIKLAMAVYWLYFSPLASLSVVPFERQWNPKSLWRGPFKGPSKLLSFFFLFSLLFKSSPIIFSETQYEFFHMGTAVRPEAAHWLSVWGTIG